MKKSLSTQQSAIQPTLSMYPEVIYDIYINNFKYNVQFTKDYSSPKNIDAFVEEQMELRKKCQINSPLIVIIDNTMCDFDEQYLPAFLNLFAQYIQNKLLFVLVSHSGNKYLHLGTDKVLAAFMYGYFNSSFFNNYFNNEVLSNKISDFNINSPTLLLTKAFVEYANEEILTYSPLIRQRTAFLYQYIIPQSLKDSGYFRISNPLFGDKVEEFPNSDGLIAIKTHYHPLINDETHHKIILLLDNLLDKIDIYNRDGFGFSQTTKVIISSKVFRSSQCLRISIGTEDLDELIEKITFVCNFLLLINSIVKKYESENQLLQNQAPVDSQNTILLDRLKQAKNNVLISSPPQRLSLQMDTKHNFFRTVSNNKRKYSCSFEETAENSCSVV